MYRAFGLLKPDTDFSLDEAERRLAAKFPGFRVFRTGVRIDVAKDDWWIALEHVTGAHVPAETEGLVGRLAGVEPAEAESYVASGARVEVWTDLSDPFMEHFNDYILVIEVLQSFGGLLAVDPKQPGVL
jgi:hypothetical protein